MNPQEFHLSITPLGDDRYLIRTEDMAAGVPVAEAQVDWPVDQWLKRSQPAMDDPILGLLQGRSPTAASASSDLNQLGHDLYEALFHQDFIRESWSRAQGIAQHRRQILRLRLGFKDSRLQRLPWEVLQSHGKSLATRVDLTFARYSADLMAAQAAQPLNLPTGDTALQVLMVIANPDDQARLNLCQEVRDIQASLQPAPGEDSRVEITVLEQPDRSALTQALEQGHYQVLHYAGHSDFGETGGDLHLVNQKTGLTERLTGEDLAGLLVNNQICLAVFNSCRSGHTAGDDAEMDWRQQNLVQALVNRGVQSVIAMAERIPDQVAIQFTQLLYKNIQRGYPIDLSLGRTRQGLVSAFSSSQHYWALPVLYLQPEFDGYLTQQDRATAAPLDPWQIDNWPAPSPSEASPTATNGAEMGAIALLETLTPESDTGDQTLVESDANLLELVEQLSQPTTAADDPPIAANQAEVLVPETQPHSRLGLYPALPENPSYRQLPLSEQAEPADSAETPAPHGALGAPQPSLARQKLSEKSLLAWVGLGAVGLVGTLVLAVFTAQKAGLFSAVVSPPEEVATVLSQDPDILLTQAQQDLSQKNYAEASKKLGRFLDQEIVARYDGNSLNTVATVLDPHDDAQILLVKGRAYWQLYLQLDEELDSNIDPTKRELKRQALETAIQLWKALTEQRPSNIEGQVALGFAYYEDTKTDTALEAWQRAEAIEVEQRNSRGEPDNQAFVNPVATYAYAGLAMVYWQYTDDADPETAAAQQAFATDYFLDLQASDDFDKVDPDALAAAVTAAQNPYAWLWTNTALRDWGQVYGAFSN